MTRCVSRTHASVTRGPQTSRVPKSRATETGTDSGLLPRRAGALAVGLPSAGSRGLPRTHRTHETSSEVPVCVFRAERERKVRVGHVPTHPQGTRLLTPAPHGCLTRLPIGSPRRQRYLLVHFVFVHVMDGMIQFLYVKLKGKNTDIQNRTSRERIRR